MSKRNKKTITMAETQAEKAAVVVRYVGDIVAFMGDNRWAHKMQRFVFTMK